MDLIRMPPLYLTKKVTEALLGRSWFLNNHAVFCLFWCLRFLCVSLKTMSIPSSLDGQPSDQTS